MKLHVLIDNVETGHFLAKIPALAGRLSQGKTKEGVLQNIHEAVEGWAEVMESKHSFVGRKPLRQSSREKPVRLRNLLRQAPTSPGNFNAL